MTRVKTIKVIDSNHNAVNNVNELEFVDGYIYANVWYKNVLLKIDPNTGIIVNEWNLEKLAKAEFSFQTQEKNSYTADCLNGIAYDPRTGNFFLTGKLYHLVFELKLN